MSSEVVDEIAHRGGRSGLYLDFPGRSQRKPAIRTALKRQTDQREESDSAIFKKRESGAMRNSESALDRNPQNLADHSALESRCRMMSYEFCVLPSWQFVPPHEIGGAA